MPINSIISNPVTNSLNAAYRPVVVSVQATRTDNTAVPPVVYCDIYFNDLFYKTITKTVARQVNPGNSIWDFDIQDAAQEYLKHYLSAPSNATILIASPVFTRCYCRLRSSGYTTSGFIQYENTAPVQGTANKASVSGTGLQTSTFYIVNSTLQHEDSQNLLSHLSLSKKRTWSAGNAPLTHRPDHVRVNRNASSVYPMLVNEAIAGVRLRYKFYGQKTFHSKDIELASSPCDAAISDPTIETGSNGYTVRWEILAGSPSKFKILTPSVNGGNPIETNNLSFLYNTLAIGHHVITVTPVCIIEGVDAPGQPKTVEIDVNDVIVPVCDPVQFIGTPNIPNATVNVPYESQISLAGTAPFTLSDIVKPASITISVTDSIITISGTFDTVSQSVPISFNVMNCNNVAAINFSKSISVSAEQGNTGCSSIPAGLYAKLIYGPPQTYNDYQWCEETLQNVQLPFTMRSISIGFFQDASGTQPATISPNNVEITLTSTYVIDGTPDQPFEDVLMLNANNVSVFYVGSFMTQQESLSLANCANTITTIVQYEINSSCFNIIS